MEKRPFYILFAGVNGAGKSTLFRSGMWEHDPVDNSLPRVNPDEILAAHGWDWRDGNAQLQAGREALQRIRDYLARGESFNQETTLSGHSILRILRHARQSGYFIVMFYIGVQNPEIANARIAHRKAIGGHSIDPIVVRKRYDSSLANLVSALDLCDETYLYDNTYLLSLVARFEREELAYLRPNIPGIDWHRGIVERFGYQEIAFSALEP